jgi:hypothetical protein
MTERKIWVFPDPLSPTMPTLAPSPIVKLTASAATTSPSGVAKRVVRSRTSRTGGIGSGPDQRHRIAVHQPVARDQDKLFQKGLRYEHAVERIVMDRRERRSGEAVT